MDYRQICYQVAEGVCTITLNRPDKLNAFTGTMGDELYHAFGRARGADEVRVIVLAGAGANFCAGVDLQALADPEEGARIAATPLLSRFPLENHGCAKPTLCAIQGAAIGVGLTMTLSFDIRIVEEGAKLAAPFARLGLMPGLGSTYLLQRLVGRGQALDLLLSGRSLGAAEALALGLAQRVVPAGEALAAVRELAATLARSKPLVLAAVKDAVNRGGDASLAEALACEAEWIARIRPGIGKAEHNG